MILDRYIPEPKRYHGRMTYRVARGSGLRLHLLALGLWQNFGDDTPLARRRAMLRRAVDLSARHFDRVNNYGPPHGSAEINSGRILRGDVNSLPDEIAISTKAGWDMWPVPYGGHRSANHLLASLDGSLQQLGTDDVDIVYSHRLDPRTPLEETMAALDTAVRQGMALYIGISSSDAPRTSAALRILCVLRAPVVLSQPRYSLVDRPAEPELLDVLRDEQLGCVIFSPLAQGLLGGSYSGGVPADSRAECGDALDPAVVTDATVARICGLCEIARRRGQTPTRLALAWTLRDPGITCTLVGVSSLVQLGENVRALEHLDLHDDELAESGTYAVPPGESLSHAPADG